MDNKHDEINTLNNLLQGVYIGIDGYSKCINCIKDGNVRHKLEHQELEQREIAMELASRIRDLGGTPKESSGVRGTMASVMTNLKLADNEDSTDALDMLLQGTRMGIQSIEKALPDVNGTAKEMLEKHLQEDKKAHEEIENLKHRIFTD